MYGLPRFSRQNCLTHLRKLQHLLRLAVIGGAILATGGSAAAAAQAAGSGAPLPSVVRPGPGDPSCARPVYPESALRNGAEGKVVLSYLIALDGAVLDGKVTRSSGHPDLDRAAYVALAKCLYRMPDGASEPRWMPATYIFSAPR